MDALEKYDLTTTEQTDKPKFEVTDLSSATWVMRKYRALITADDDVKRVAQEQITDIQKWLDEQLQANQDSRAFFEEKLGDYLTRLRVDDPKAKIKTPYGTVSTRKSRAGVVWSDEAVVKSLEDQGLTELIRVKKEPEKKEIAKQFHFVGNRYVNDDGQVLVGASPKEATESLTIKPTKEGLL